MNAQTPIRIVEVGPRDGLQNETAIIPTEVKVAFVNALSKTGVADIEVSSFVSPRWVPQLADAEEVFKKIERAPGVTYSALVPNEQGLERALAVGVDKIAVFTAASETFNKKNINATIIESIERFRPVVTRAKAERLLVRGYISTAFYCPYEGQIHPQQVVPTVKALLDLGVDEISLGDTIGKAAPRNVRTLLDTILLLMPKERLALHLHDTYGLAIANALVAWEEYEIGIFDASAGGLGGCPYAPGASGNIATEDLVYALQASGAQLSVQLEAVIASTQMLKPYVQRSSESRLGRVFRAT